jgi:hypothetical protein
MSATPSKFNLPEAAEAGLLPLSPPLRGIRWMAWIVIGLVGAAGLFAIAVKVPETVRSPFVLIPEQGTDPLQAPLAWLWVPESAVGRLAKGQRVRLFFEAYPYQRHGTVPATIRWISPAAVKMGDERHFVAQADLETPTIRAGAQSQKLRIGMKGEARVSIGHRTLAEYAFEPIRQLRENLRR